MKFISLPSNFNNYQYSMSEWTGDLLIQHSKIDNSQYLPCEKVSKALLFCNNPYDLDINRNPESESEPISKNLRNKARILVLLCRFNFFLAMQYASLKTRVFPDSAHAIAYFHSITAKDDINSLCLPRTLFAAKTSKAFDMEGVILMGAFLPSRLMHAWIIEKCVQPDARDNSWHQFRPIAAIS
jgi:hypothetical protein